MGITQEQIHKEKARALDLVAQYRDGLYREPQLRSLFLELTMTCNSRCFHCGSRCEPGVPSGLPKEAYLQVLREVRDNFDQRHMMLCITGGEPMLYPDFFELMGEAKDMGFRWGMTTNGTLITREKARLLRETGMGTVSVSIDGLEKTHDRQRGLPGGYRLAMEGIQNLIDVGGFKTIQVTTVINHSNIDELDPLYEIFEKMDIDSWRVINLEPIGRALEYPDLMLTKEDYRRLFAFIYQKRMERMPVTYGCSHFLGLDLERELRGWYFFCEPFRVIYSGILLLMSGKTDLRYSADPCQTSMRNAGSAPKPNGAQEIPATAGTMRKWSPCFASRMSFSDR